MEQQVQKTVHFYGDELVGIQDAATGMIYVPLNRMCDNLGIGRNRQLQRVRDHPVLGDGCVTLAVTTPGGAQEAHCLRLDLIPLWLAGVNANRVAAEVRSKLVQYQTEAASVLWAAFRPDILPPGNTALAAHGTSGAAVAYEIATAIQHLARQQMELEQRLEERIDHMARWANRVDGRLETLELRVTPQAVITEQQAAEVALAVKHVGNALIGQGARSGYGQVYSELYRRYGISSYKHLPQRNFEEVLQWLRSWFHEIQGGAT